MRSVINNVPLVEELVIDIETIKDKDIQRIASKCPQLKRLSFNRLMNVFDNFFDLLRHFPNLRELSILGSIHTRQQSTSLKHCRLEKLSLRSFNYTVYTLFSAIPTLTHLEMESSTAGYFEHYQTLPSLTLFPVLTDLRFAIYHVDAPTNALASFFKAHPLIRTLSLNLKKIDPVIMASLATDLVHLKRLDLISSEHLPPFTKSLPSVEKLTLRRCNMNTDFMVGMAMHFPNLHYIHIDDSTRRQSSGGISQSKRQAIEALTQLKYLDLTFHDTVPDKLKVYLPRRRFWPDLLMDDLRHIRETALGLVWIE
ncbi:hypothetical protein [Absidia glauca]|uniref:F-box domain-containing protein n=1 Tax=Absidia glauca TaxID=4829 RepID=A0A168LYE3_ABSGL|nr:hypothetical protein [Absidia glauca]